MRARNVLTAALLLLAGCGSDRAVLEGHDREQSTAVESFEAVEATEDVLGLIHDGKFEPAAQAIQEHTLYDGLSQVIFLVAAACESEQALEYLVEEAELDPAAQTVDGRTAIYELLYPFEDEPGLALACSGAPRVRALESLLELGANPCVAPEHSRDDAPALSAADWGVEADAIKLLAPYADACA